MITVESQRSVRSAPTLPLDTRLGTVRIAATDRANSSDGPRAGKLLMNFTGLDG